MKNYRRSFIVMIVACLMAGVAFGQVQHSVLADPDAPQAQPGPKGTLSATDNGTLGYFYQFTDDNLYTFPVPAGAPQLVVGPAGDFAFYCGEIGPGGVYYAADYNTGVLYSLNTADGSATALGGITGALNGAIENYTGMAYHEATNTMYFSTYYNGSHLYTLNVNTRVLSYIGQITPNIIIFLAINCDGELYGVEILTDVLMSINTVTGAGTVIGPTNYAANFAQGADFDNQSGILYWAAYQSGGVGSLRTIDLQTGNSTEVVPLLMEVDAFVVLSACEAVPVAWWAIAIGIFLITLTLIWRIRR